VVITPIILGFAMAHVGKYRTKKRKKTVRLETFFNAYLFALGFALIRFFFAK
jgi:cytochrome c biogenesis protein CcdA